MEYRDEDLLVARTDDPFPFLWSVAQRGYKWVEGPFRLITDPHIYGGRALVGVGDQVRPAQLSPGLFLKFSRLQSDDEMQQFAATFGLLRGGYPLASQNPDEAAKSDGAAIFGELQSKWEADLFEMQAAVELWDAIQKKNNSKLAERIKWRRPHLITYEGPERTSHSGKPFHDSDTLTSPEIIKHFKPGDLLMPARVFLQRMVNAKADEHVKYRLLWMKHFTKQGTFVVPRDLLGFLWLQLTKAIEEFSCFRHCAVCGGLMIIAPQGIVGYRSNRRTCGDPCRMRLHERRKKVQKLIAEGLSLKEIAKQLEATIPQIRTWLPK